MVLFPGKRGKGLQRRSLRNSFVWETLSILRKKLQEGLELEELLGENSHLFLRALTKQILQRKSIEAAKKKLATI